jgi:tetratricopeptide (TPR) repeat protein
MKNTKKILFTFFVSAFGLLLISNDVSSQQTAGELFEKALYMEEAKGDLQKAIDLYQKILKQFPENREVAAKAQLHIGLCYEKLGLKEAQNAFQKVVDNYPNQQQEVAIAREKLSKLVKLAEALDKVPHKPTFRKIRIPANPSNGVLSPDGKRLAFISEERLWVIPVAGNVEPDLAGEPVTLTEPMEA